MLQPFHPYQEGGFISLSCARRRISCRRIIFYLILNPISTKHKMMNDDPMDADRV